MTTALVKHEAPVEELPRIEVFCGVSDMKIFGPGGPLDPLRHRCIREVHGDSTHVCSRWDGSEFSEYIEHVTGHPTEAKGCETQ